jgi:hypothetical protein
LREQLAKEGAAAMRRLPRGIVDAECFVGQEVLEVWAEEEAAASPNGIKLKDVCFVGKGSNV